MREQYTHKVLTHVEYRAVSGVFQNIGNIDPPPSPPSECVFPPATPIPRAVRGLGVNILEDARHRIGLLPYNLFTNTQVAISRQFCWGDWRGRCNSSGGGSQSESGAPPHFASWTENTIMTECTRESRDLQSTRIRVYSLQSVVLHFNH